ncbi:MAG: hypothetical protein ABUL60_08285 [Myxococcales bacterium]
MTELEWQPLVANLTTAAARAGFDLVQAFSVAHYNAAAPATERLDDLGRAALPGALGVVFGNTRELWPAFTTAYTQDAALERAEHPLDAYVVTRLSSLLADATSARSQLIFAHVTTPRAFPIQRLAERVGLAALSPSHLAIHPQHGPWLALRAVAVIDVAGPPGPLPPVARPCLGCSAPCLAALEQARLVSGEPLSSAAIARHAGAWVAVRDACPVGRGSRYGANQLAYHYAPAHSRIRPEA